MINEVSITYIPHLLLFFVMSLVYYVPLARYFAWQEQDYTHGIFRQSATPTIRENEMFTLDQLEAENVNNGKSTAKSDVLSHSNWQP